MRGIEDSVSGWVVGLDFGYEDKSCVICFDVVKVVARCWLFGVVVLSLSSDGCIGGSGGGRGTGFVFLIRF